MNYLDLGCFEQQDSCKMVSSDNLQNRASFFSVFPNPSVGGILNFKVLGAEGESGIIRLVNSLGRQLVEQQVSLEAANSIQVRELPAGTYFVFLQVGHRIYSSKWMVI